MMTAPLTAPACLGAMRDDDDRDAATDCPHPATTTRVIHGVEVPLCADHATEYDREAGE